MKLCKAPTNHTQCSIPETFVGHSAQFDHEEAGQAAFWSYQCINRGSLGSASLLTSALTLINGDDSITVEALWDHGSKSSFFSAALFPIAVSQRDQSVKIETLSQNASEPEVVHRVGAVFQEAVPGGEMVTLSLLQNTCLEICQMKSKSKLLACSENFPNKYCLKRTGLSEPCSNGQHCLMRSQAKLSIILGMNPHQNWWNNSKTNKDFWACTRVPCQIL